MLERRTGWTQMFLGTHSESPNVLLSLRSLNQKLSTSNSIHTEEFNVLLWL